jgi:hypothetical protein
MSWRDCIFAMMSERRKEMQSRVHGPSRTVWLGTSHGNTLLRSDEKRLRSFFLPVLRLLRPQVRRLQESWQGVVRSRKTRCVAQTTDKNWKTGIERDADHCTMCIHLSFAIPILVSRTQNSSVTFQSSRASRRPLSATWPLLATFGRDRVAHKACNDLPETEGITDEPVGDVRVDVVSEVRSRAELD